MPTERQSLKQAEEFVRNVLAKSFNQKLDRETLRAVAEKVSRAATPSTPMDARSAKRAA